MSDGISLALQRFLLECVENYEQLHALLHLLRRRDVPLGSGEASATLGVSEEAALEALQALRDRGLVAMIGPPNQPLFRLERAPHLDAVLEELQGAHDQKPVEVAKLMTANAIDRARTLTARRFADAFLLRRAKKDDG